MVAMIRGVKQQAGPLPAGTALRVGRLQGASALKGNLAATLRNFAEPGVPLLPKFAREQTIASFGSAGHQPRCASNDASALHERRELVEVFQDQRDIFLELNGLCGLERRLEL